MLIIAAKSDISQTDQVNFVGLGFDPDHLNLDALQYMLSLKNGCFSSTQTPKKFTCSTLNV